MRKLRTPDDGAEYEVGYRKPPTESQFKKGISGNPRGRARTSMSPGRLREVALEEIFRPIKIRDGDRVKLLSAFQVAIRQLMQQAVKGDKGATRHVLQLTQWLEHELALGGAWPAANQREVTDEERARHLAAFVAIARARREAEGVAKLSDQTRRRSDNE